MKILLPDYYKKFRCKCGDCRHCCCNGWGITLSYVEYCRLLGLDCSAELRKKIDCAFYFPHDRDENRYAEIKMNYYGNCPLQREDGFCGLQCECGEEVLPSVCRMYPRNILNTTMEEGACANSCEKVVEMLWEEKEGIRLVETETCEEDFAGEKERKIQTETVVLLQNRKCNLAERLILWGKNVGEKRGTVNDPIRFLIDTAEALEEYSPAFREISARCKNNSLWSEDIPEEELAKRYRKAKEKFSKSYPDYEAFFENIMVNHLIFTRYPHVSKDNIFEQYAGACGIYAVMNLVCVSYTENKDTVSDLVDCVAGLFRCFEHSEAAEEMVWIMKKTNNFSSDFLTALLRTV